MVQNQKTIRTRTLLLDALRSLLQQKRTLSEITVTELCSTAGVTRSTFYRHYNIPKDLIDELWQQVDLDLNLDLSQIQAPGPLSDPVVDTWCRRIYADRDKWQLILLSGFNPPIKVSPLDSDFYAHYAGRGFSRTEADLLFQFVLDGTMGIVGRWILCDQPEPPEQFAEQVSKIMKLLQG